MSSVKTSPTKKPTAKNGVSAVVPVSDVLTLSEAAGYLRVREQDVVDMVNTQGLSGRRIGTEWRFLKSALQSWLGGATNKPSKQVLLHLAGKFRDDPYLEEITREAYQRRGGQAAEAGD